MRAAGGRPKLKHNCSGKHAGMLAALPGPRLAGGGLPPPGPSLPARAPRAATLPPARPCPHRRRRLRRRRLRGSARGGPRGRSRRSTRASRVAMRTHPDLVGGAGAILTPNLDARAAPGWVAKRGAEGLVCAASRRTVSRSRAEGRGRQSARAPAGPRSKFLDTLGLDGSVFGPTPLRNSRDEVVGEVKVS